MTPQSEWRRGCLAHRAAIRMRMSEKLRRHVGPSGGLLIGADRRGLNCALEGAQWRYRHADLAEGARPESSMAGTTPVASSSAKNTEPSRIPLATNPIGVIVVAEGTPNHFQLDSGGRPV